MNSKFGTTLKVNIFGESHGDFIGCEVSGFPKGETVDLTELAFFMDRRKPGGALTTPRKEADLPTFESGLSDGALTGDTLRAVIQNTNKRSGDYENLRFCPRPSHADYTARCKYGDSMDLRGGGHFSGRLTAPLCVAGGIAKQILARRGIFVGAHLMQVGSVSDEAFPLHPTKELFEELAAKSFPTLSDQAATAMQEEIKDALSKNDSVGGMIECAIIGLPVGLGTPRYQGMESKLAEVCFGIPAIKGIAFGSGYDCVSSLGSQYNDPFILVDGKVETETNHVGGVLGGITNGMPVTFTLAMKPTPSIGAPQRTVNIATMEETTIVIEGRHDPCVAIRAVPVAEAAAALVVLDMLLTEGQFPSSANADLTDIRSEIDALDQQLVTLFQQRMEAAKAVADYKKEHHLPILNEGREAEVIAKARANAPGMEDFAEAFVKDMMKLSKDYQADLLK